MTRADVKTSPIPQCLFLIIIFGSEKALGSFVFCFVLLFLWVFLIGSKLRAPQIQSRQKKP